MDTITQINNFHISGFIEREGSKRRFSGYLFAFEHPAERTFFETLKATISGPLILIRHAGRLFDVRPALLIPFVI